MKRVLLSALSPVIATLGALAILLATAYVFWSLGYAAHRAPREAGTMRVEQCHRERGTAIEACYRRVTACEGRLWQDGGAR